jgi:hypothetical protein
MIRMWVGGVRGADGEGPVRRYIYDAVPEQD